MRPKTEKRRYEEHISSNGNIDVLKCVGSRHHGLPGFSRILLDVGQVLSSSLVARVLNFVTGILVIRLLPSDEYGLFAFGLLISQLLPQLGDLGLTETTVRFGSEYRERNAGLLAAFLRYVLRVRLMAVGVLAVVVVFATPSIHLIFGKGELRQPFVLGALGGIGGILWAYVLSFYQLQGWFSRYAGLNVGYSVLLLLGVAVGSVLGADRYWYPLGVYVSVPFVCSILPFVVVLRSTRHGRCGEIPWRATVMRFGLWLTLSTVCWVVLRRADMLLLSRFAPLGTLGAYAAALQLTQPLQVLAQSVGTVMFPRVAAMTTNYHFRQFARMSYIFSLALLVLLAIPLGLWGKLIFVFLGRTYVEGVDVFRILLVVPAVGATANLLSYVVLAKNRPDVPAKINMAQAVLNLVLMYLLIPSYGATGAAVATALTTLAGAFGIALYVEISVGRGSAKC